MSGSPYSFENVKTAIEQELERCRKDEAYWKDGRGVRNWAKYIRYHDGMAYNGVCRGDMTRDEYDRIRKILADAKVV